MRLQNSAWKRMGSHCFKNDSFMNITKEDVKVKNCFKK